MKVVGFAIVLVVALGLLALTCETSAASVKQRTKEVLNFYRQSSSIASSSSCQAFNSSCSTCTDRSDCVWCVSSNGHKSCIDGGFFGPSGSNDCDSWYNSASCSMKGGDFIIIIASCGGGVLLILIIVILCCCMRRCKKRRPEYVPYVPSDMSENRPLTASEQKRQEIREKYSLGNSGSYNGGNSGYSNSGNYGGYSRFEN